jgi:transcriptional regulator with XRE-family HTH domain
MTSAPATGRPATRPASPEPAIQRHQLGQFLRELRAARGLRLEDAAAALGITPSTLSRIETGKAPARAAYISALLNLYDVTDPRQRAQLTTMARHGHRQTNWTAGNLIPAATRHYLGLENAATRLRAYSPLAIPDLLQTPEYATAACAATHPGLNHHQISDLTQTILHRQETLRDQRRHYHFILDESALQRAIAPARAMTAQLDRLAALAAAPNITIQAATLTPAPPVIAPPFTILTLPGTTHPDIAAWHGHAGHHNLVTRPAELTQLHHAFTRLAQAALPPTETTSLITTLAG